MPGTKPTALCRIHPVHARRRATGHRAAGRAALLALTFLLVGAAPARASLAPLDLNRFHPAPGTGTLLTIDLADVGRPFELTPRLAFHYADQLLRYRASDGTRTVVVQDRLTTDLSLAFSLFGRLQISVALPVVLSQGGSAGNDIDMGGNPVQVVPKPASAGLEDTRIGLKARIWSNAHFGVGAAAEVMVPTGNADSYLGTGVVTGTVRALAHATVSRLTVGLNLGLQWAAADNTFLGVHTGNSLVYGLGAQVALLEREAASLYLLGELYGLTHASFSFPAGSTASSPLEAMGAFKVKAGDWGAFLGAGGGLTQGYGEPRFRVVGGVSYSWAPGPKRLAASPPGEEARRREDEPAPRASQTTRPPTRAATQPSSPPSAAPPPSAPPAASGVAAAAGQGPLVTVPDKGARLVLKQQIRFQEGSDVLRADSLPLLDQVATLLLQLPALGALRIDTHADEGDETASFNLSRRRAAAVQAYLTQRGVASHRLAAAAYGSRCPKVESDTPEGRVVNSRVDLVLIKREPVHPRVGQCPDGGGAGAKAKGKGRGKHRR